MTKLLDSGIGKVEVFWQYLLDIAITLCVQQFHPDDTLIASASLDQTVRVWDFAKLKEKSQ